MSHTQKRKFMKQKFPKRLRKSIKDLQEGNVTMNINGKEYKWNKKEKCWNER